MIRKYVLSLLAIAGFVLAVYTVRAGSKPIIAAQPVAAPSQSPYQYYVAGAGIVEASSRNIAISTPVAGLVTKVFVEAGDEVKANAPMFSLDDRDLQATLLVRKAALAATQAQMDKLVKLPRPEDVPATEARLKAAESNLADRRAELARWQSVDDERAVSKETLDRRRYAVQTAEAQLAEATADLALLKAGSWAPDIEIARANVASAESQVKQSQTDIDRLTVRSPVDGQVLQLNVRVGEFAQTGRLETPLLIVGSTNLLQVRVDVDENDAWRIKSGAKAQAFLRGNKHLNTALDFVRFEPYVVPKKSLTGGSTERVDTRVLQILYSFERRKLPVYVGQQVDVFIEAEPLVAAENEGVGNGAQRIPAGGSR